MRKQKTLHILLALLFVLACLCLILPTEAYAQPERPVTNEELMKDSGSGGDDLSGLVAKQGIVVRTLYNLFTGIGALAIWVGGFLLDYSVSLLVVDMGSFIKAANLGPGITMLWAVIRDLFNLAFIFSLIYLGFKTILRSNESQTKRTLVTILAAALLINFSLFFTKFVIDFSNLAAYEIYQAIEIKGTTSIFFGNIEVSGIAGEFIRLTDLNNYDKSAAGNISKIGEGAFGGFVFVFFGLLIMCCLLAAAFVFAAGAVLLISRFITLIILMIFSPILFLGWVLPSFKNYSDQWMNKFLNNAFIAPAYLFMLYLALSLLSQISSYTNNATGINGGLDFEDTGLFGFFIFYALIIGFLWAALLVAQKMSVAGSNQAIAMGKRFAGGVTAGATARIGRGSVGRIGQAVADSDYVKNKASQAGVAGFLSRRALEVGEAAGSASFDARGVGGVGKKLGVGEGKKGGFKKTRDDYVKKQQAYTKKLGEVGEKDKEVKKLQAAVDEAQFEYDNAPKARKAGAKFVLEEAKEALNTEKQRRALGSVSQLGLDGLGLKNKREGLAKNVKIYYDRFNDPKSTKEEKEEYAKKIFEFKKQLQATKEEIEKVVKESGYGYANVLERDGAFKSNYLSSWIQGHPKAFENKAGKDIRKAFSKKAKETKEDKRFGSLKSVLEDNKKAA